jgi:hypothetical protein
MFNQYWIFDFRSKHRLSPSEATAARFLPVTASGSDSLPLHRFLFVMISVAGDIADRLSLL